MTKRKWTIVLATIIGFLGFVGVSQTVEQRQAPVATAQTNSHAGHNHGADAEEDAHAGHDHTADAREGQHTGDALDDEGIQLTSEQIERFGIVVRLAGPGRLRSELRLPGEIVFNEDRVVHVVPRVAGIVRDVTKTVGDHVSAGEVLAVIDSRELADAKAGFLAAQARTALAEKTFARERTLFEKQVSSEQDFLEAEQTLAETRIGLRSAQHKLYALGLSQEAMKMLDDDHGAITRYEIHVPFDGVVTQKHITLGESLAATDHIFTIADTSHVWANLTVYTKNLAAVRKGQEVALRVDHSGARGRGQVAMVTPFLEESTRSATARLVLDNNDGRWMPGTFVTGLLSLSEDDLPLVVPKGAVQTVEGNTVLFVEHDDGFEITPVTIGRGDSENVEILSGLKAGTPYVAKGAFELKATLVTSNLGSHAGHGH